MIIIKPTELFWDTLGIFLSLVHIIEIRLFSLKHKFYSANIILQNTCSLTSQVHIIGITFTVSPGSNSAIRDFNLLNIKAAINKKQSIDLQI